MKSLINPAIELSENNWCVSLVKRATHTMIIVESVGLATGEQYKMRSFDFLPVDHHELQSFTKSVKAWAKNEKFIGEVREIEYKLLYDDLNAQLVDCEPTYLKNDRKVLFKIQSWSEKEVESWVCPADNVRKMVANIREDIEKANNKEMILQYRGKPKLNCTSWAEEKILCAGIHTKHHHFFLSQMGFYSGTLIDGTHLPHFHKRNYTVTEPVTEPTQVCFKKN